jgi:FixJ family two-component response regulator
VISIVDDDESIRASTKTLLRSVGYEVQTFASAHDLLQSGVVRQTECLILDVRMPGIDGLQLQRRLHDEGFRVPIIFVTAYDDSFVRRRAVECGAVDVLHKPFDATLFLAAVHAACEGRPAHIPYERLREVAKHSLAETGYAELTSVLSLKEREHFRGCPDCIDAFGNIIREIVRERKEG